MIGIFFLFAALCDTQSYSHFDIPFSGVYFVHLKQPDGNTKSLNICIVLIVQDVFDFIPHTICKSC